MCSFRIKLWCQNPELDSTLLLTYRCVTLGKLIDSSEPEYFFGSKMMIATALWFFGVVS